MQQQFAMLQNNMIRNPHLAGMPGPWRGPMIPPGVSSMMRGPFPPGPFPPHLGMMVSIYESKLPF